MKAEVRHLPDQKLEAMLNRLRKNSPNIQCLSGNKINKLYINPNCKISLRCGQLGCLNCGKAVHFGCGSIPLEEITEMINNRAESSREFIFRIFNIEQNFIEKIRKSQMQFIEKYGFGKLEGQYVKLMEAIYQPGGDLKRISGKDALDFCQTLQVEGENSLKKDKGRLDNYSEDLDRLIKQFQTLKQKCLFEDIISINSNILITKNNLIPDVSFIHKALNYPKQLKLIFRASEHDFKGSAFHKYCDNINDTLVLIRTQFGKTIAGYSHYKWNHVESGMDVCDSAKKSFLLQLDLHEKYVPVDSTSLICCNDTCGPIFGKGSRDIYIPDSCNYTLSHGKFPSGYNKEGLEKYVQEQESYTTFSGATNGFKFRSVDYEVFRVIYG